jgi:twitching motility protein PilT
MALSADVIFTQAAKEGASDVHLQVGAPVTFRIHKELLPVSADLLMPEHMNDLIRSILGSQYERFIHDKELDASYQVPNGVRLRINAHYSLGHPGIVARIIPENVPTLESIGLDWIVDRLHNLHEGLLLFTGPTGAGKSTSMAGVINYIRQNRSVHVITLEDPIEFHFEQMDQGLIRQSEYGEDFYNLPDAMRRILRQDPDIVMVGEMRDLETISAALTLAETGHLVIATLHTPNALQTIDRIIDVFPPHQQPQIRSQLSLTLKMIVAQRLVPGIEHGLVAMREVLVNTVAAANTIREGRTQELLSVMQMSGENGMITFDKAAEALLKNKQITMETYEETIGFIRAISGK